MNKLIIVNLCLVVVLHAQFLSDKNVALPLFVPQSTMSDSVKKFIEQMESDSGIVKTVKKDVLGRASTGSISYLQKSDKKMKVVVSYERTNHLYKTSLHGRYEFSSEGEGLFWLNDTLVNEETYFKKWEKMQLLQKEETSEYTAPHVEYLTAADIKRLIGGSRLVSIVEYKDPMNLSTDTTVSGVYYMADSLIRVKSQIQTHAFPLNYKGSDIGIYFTETGCPKTSHLNASLYVQGNTCVRGVRVHPTGVARILQTTATEAKIYGFDQENYPINPADYSTPIYIGSHSWSISADSVYMSEDKEMDNYIYSNKVIEFVAAGNTKGTTNYVTSPGKSVNAITVGAITPDTDTYASYSGWKNPSMGNQKPEVVNYTHFYFPHDSYFSVIVDGSLQTYNGTFNGTSASTPYSAGMAADILSQHPFFKWHPEMFKALMMTGSTQYIANSFYQGDKDNYSRIRNIPFYSKMAWNTRSSYWNGDNSSFFDSDSTISFKESNIQKGKTYRIAIAWLSLGSYVLTNQLLPQDLDLFIYQDGNLIASSESATNPFELVDFTTTSSSDLTVVIKRVRNAFADNVVLGYNFLQTN